MSTPDTTPDGNLPYLSLEELLTIYRSRQDAVNIVRGQIDMRVLLLRRAETDVRRMALLLKDCRHALRTHECDSLVSRINDVLDGYEGEED